jgi:hypothetical protein
MISLTRSFQENKAGRTPCLGGFFRAVLQQPEPHQASAVATMGSSFDRGAQPGMRLALSLFTVGWLSLPWRCDHLRTPVIQFQSYGI